VWNARRQRWDELATATATTGEREWTAAMPSQFGGFLENESLRFRLLCTLPTTGVFGHRTDLFELSYERAMVP